MPTRPTQPHRRNRRAINPALRGVDAVAVMSIVATKLRLTLDIPAVANAIPTKITRQAAGAGSQLPATAIEQVSAQVIDVTFAAALVATDVVTIGGGEPGIRTYSGGFVAAATKTF